MAQTMGWSLGNLSGQTWFVPFWGENPKTPKLHTTKKNLRSFGKGLWRWKPSKPGKTKKPKLHRPWVISGETYQDRHGSVPSRQTWSVQFWFFGFLVFHEKPKNQNCTDHGWSLGSSSRQTWSVQFWFFGFLVFHEKQKKQNCTDHGWSLGSPSRQTWSVQFWFFGFLVFHEKTKKPKNQNCTDHGWFWGAHLDRHGLCNFGFLVFWFSMKKPKNQKTKIAQTMGDLWGAHLDRHGLCNFGFLVFHEKTKKKTKKPKLHRPWVISGEPISTDMVCAILFFWFFGFPWKNQKNKKPQTMGDLWGDTYMHMYYRKSKKQI